MKREFANEEPFPHLHYSAPDVATPLRCVRHEHELVGGVNRDAKQREHWDVLGFFFFLRHLHLQRRHFACRLTQP